MTDKFTLQQVRLILMFGRLEGSPTEVERIVADLKAKGKWPEVTTTRSSGGYDVMVVPYSGRLRGGDWLIRVYDEGGRHVHSAEGGVSLAVGLREVQRAIERDQAADTAEHTLTISSDVLREAADGPEFSK